jgi:hypothetical protein
MTEKISAAGRLSGKIYKMYTLLSTDIVENEPARVADTSSERLAGCGSQRILAMPLA